MARRPTDITRSGRGKVIRTEIDGLKELEATVRDLIALGDEGLSVGQRAARTRQAQQKLYDVLGEGAGMLKARVKANAEAQGWPKAVIAAIFTYADMAKDRRKRRAALAGVRKGAPPRRDMKIYREWYPGRSKSMRAKSLVLPGTKSAKGTGLQKIGMSLASMFEYGTSKMSARPAFRPALKAAQQQVLQHIANGYKYVIEHFTEAA